jgi:hypothetical protein
VTFRLANNSLVPTWIGTGTQDVIQRLVRDHKTLVIAYRLSAIHNPDLIAVLAVGNSEIEGITNADSVQWLELCDPELVRRSAQ